MGKLLLGAAAALGLAAISAAAPAGAQTLVVQGGTHFGHPAHAQVFVAQHWRGDRHWDRRWDPRWHPPRSRHWRGPPPRHWRGPPPRSWHRAPPPRAWAPPPCRSWWWDGWAWRCRW